MINRTNATKKNTAPTIKNPNLIVAEIEVINGTKDAKSGVMLSMISKLIFSIKSKIPATIGVRLM